MDKKNLSHVSYRQFVKEPWYCLMVQLCHSSVIMEKLLAPLNVMQSLIVED